MIKRNSQIIDIFGTAIREKRKNLGISMTDAAKICGVSTTYYNYLERCMRPGVSLVMAATIAEKLGLEITIHIRSENMSKKPDSK